MTAEKRRVPQVSGDGTLSPSSIYERIAERVQAPAPAGPQPGRFRELKVSELTRKAVSGKYCWTSLPADIQHGDTITVALDVAPPDGATVWSIRPATTSDYKPADSCPVGSSIRLIVYPSPARSAFSVGDSGTTPAGSLWQRTYTLHKLPTEWREEVHPVTPLDHNAGAFFGGVDHLGRREVSLYPREAVEFYTEDGSKATLGTNGQTTVKYGDSARFTGKLRPGFIIPAGIDLDFTVDFPSRPWNIVSTLTGLPAKPNSGDSLPGVSGTWGSIGGSVTLSGGRYGLPAQTRVGASFKTDWPERGVQFTPRSSAGWNFILTFMSEANMFYMSVSLSAKAGQPAYVSGVGSGGYTTIIYGPNKDALAAKTKDSPIRTLVKHNCVEMLIGGELFATVLPITKDKYFSAFEADPTLFEIESHSGNPEPLVISDLHILQQAQPVDTSSTDG